MNPSDKFRKYINNYLEINNISFREFAKTCNVPNSTLQSIFDSGIEKAGVNTINKVCRILNITIEDLFNNTITDNLSCSNNRTVVSIGRGGERAVYEISDDDAAIVNAFIEKMAKKNS